MTQQHAETHGGVLRSFDAGTYRATVQLTGSLATWVASVPVSRAIASAEMVVGRRVVVLVLDPSNPGDAVVTAVYT